MPATTIDDIRDALGLGLGVVTRIWEYKTKGWVTSIFAADIDNDGDIEVIPPCVLSNDSQMGKIGHRAKML